VAGGTKGKIERTTKGGLHVIVSQVQSLASGDGAGITFDSAILSYLQANPSHSYYLSLWYNITRVDPSTSPTNDYSEMVSIGMNNSTATMIAALMGTGQFFPASNLGVQAVTNALGLALASIGAASPAGTPSTFGRAAAWGAATASGYNAAVLSSRNGHWPSWAYYRTYLEDLTVSGRTYATVRALDVAAQATAFASGGRYNGDTIPTAPSTIP
jgi:hypothetical protein